MTRLFIEQPLATPGSANDWHEIFERTFLSKLWSKTSWKKSFTCWGWLTFVILLPISWFHYTVLHCSDLTLDVPVPRFPPHSGERTLQNSTEVLKLALCPAYCLMVLCTWLWVKRDFMCWDYVAWRPSVQMHGMDKNLQFRPTEGNCSILVSLGFTNIWALGTFMMISRHSGQQNLE